jgi:hypothetical protein
MLVLVVVAVLVGAHAAAAGPKVEGSGTPGTIPQWTAPTTLGDSVMVQSSNNIGIGTSTPAAKLEVNGNVQADGALSATGAINSGLEYEIKGSRVLGADATTGNTEVGMQALQNNTTGGGNTATGTAALFNNTTGAANTATGVGALFHNTTGLSNTAFGAAAMAQNTIGSSNTAIGEFALPNNTTGSFNTATGSQALENSSTGTGNTATGYNALVTSTTGSNNTAIGVGALQLNDTGSNNIAVGAGAGFNVMTGDNNIHIGNMGVLGDSATTRIGGSLQTKTFVGGIYGATTGAAAVTVLVDSNGQLGIMSSSRRVKDDVHDMGEASRGIWRLRPVTFHYKQSRADDSRPRQYGLIAEEVAEVYPELVAYDPTTGDPQTVLYHELPAILLNEIQAQHRQLGTQAEQLESQAKRIAAQAEDLDVLRARMAILERMLAERDSAAR